MKVGDRFFTIAYTFDTRVIEVEVIGIEIIEGETYIHFQNVEQVIDKWFKTFDFIKPYIFNTKEEAESKLNLL